MKKSLVVLALSTVGFAPVFGGATGPAHTPQQPTSAQPTPAKPVEVKKIAAQAEEKQASTAQTPSTTTPSTPAPVKPKLMLIAEEKAACCPCPKDKSEPSVEKKEAQKPQTQTPVKAAAPKVALA